MVMRAQAAQGREKKGSGWREAGAHATVTPRVLGEKRRGGGEEKRRSWQARRMVATDPGALCAAAKGKCQDGARYAHRHSHDSFTAARRGRAAADDRGRPRRNEKHGGVHHRHRRKSVFASEGPKEKRQSDSRSVSMLYSERVDREGVEVRPRAKYRGKTK